MHYRKNGFTIIELLIVIVVIGILASVIIVSYSGLTQKANVASLQADVSNAKKAIQVYFAQYNSYPTTITSCSNPSATEICVKPTGSNIFSYIYNNSTNPSFSVTASYGGISYLASDTVAATLIPSFISNGMVLNLDPSSNSSYSGSGNTWTDISGSNNNATLYNSPTFNSAISNIPASFSFNGTNQYARVPSLDNTNFPTNSTISVWLNLSARPSAYSQSILDAWDGTRDNIFIRTIGYTNLQVAFMKTGNTSSYPYVTSYTNFVTDRWFNIVVQADVTNKIGRVYLNGNLFNSSSIIDATWSPTGQAMYIMVAPTGGYNTLGKLGAFQIYNRILSASEISQNFNALRGFYGI